MNLEKSCGAVVFTEIDGTRQYLLIRNHKGIYGFPKGHVEAGETETETALREIREETDLHVTILEGFRYVERYPVVKKPDTMKDVVYFVAKYLDQEPHYQESELTGAELHPYEEALELLSWEERRKILKLAEEFLRT